MAQQRAPLASHALEDIRVPLTSIRDRRDAVEAPSDPRDIVPEPSNQLRTFVTHPLPDGSDLLNGFASLRPGGKRERLVTYPIRLPATQIAALESLREERGIIPAEFIRDAVASCLALLRKA